MGVAHVRIAGGGRALRPQDLPLTRLLAATLLLIVAILLLTPGAAGAHEIGTTQVRLALHHDHTWSASITTGPQSLLNKLETEARQPRTNGLGAEELRAALGEFRATLARHVHVDVDGVSSPVSVSIAALDVPSDANLPAFVELVATGPLPPQSQRVTWRYDLAYSTYALTFVAGEGATPSTTWIEGDADSPPLAIDANVRPPTRTDVIEQYLQLGFLHILPRGADHILFVLGIVLLTTRPRPILTQVTAFTIAHSITLGLTMYGIVSLSPRIVEPLIAVSIAYVAIENIITSELTPWRPAVVFVFGLLHGMGFAGVLRHLQLPRGEFVPALISFNVGIELAQLTVIALAFLSVAMWCRNRPWYRARVVIPASALIAVTGLVWTVQRIAMW